MTSAAEPAPRMPVISEGEMYRSGLPYTLVDGLPRTIGWQWQPDAKGGPSFVIIGRGAMGGYKILERYPFTDEGWQRAWSSFAGSSPDAIAVVTARLAARGVEAPPVDTQPVLIVTTNDVPGHQITHVHGDVFGLIVRARNVFSNFGASLRTIAGGEVAGYTKLLSDSRNQARERMWHEARARGANAVVAMRFDCNEIGDIMSEIVAYGTAVTVEPINARHDPTTELA